MDDDFAPSFSEGVLCRLAIVVVEKKSQLQTLGRGHAMITNWVDNRVAPPYFVHLTFNPSRLHSILNVDVSWLFQFPVL